MSDETKKNAGGSDSLHELVGFYIGKTHDRPDLLELNTELESRGSQWRVTVSKSIGLHIWNPTTHMCRCPNIDGYIE